jgi:hypothetical protein
MKYQCEFVHALTGARKTVIADVTADEMACAKASHDPELYAQAYALSHAYRQVQGFMHDGPPRKLS